MCWRYAVSPDAFSGVPISAPATFFANAFCSGSAGVSSCRPSRSASLGLSALEDCIRSFAFEFLHYRRAALTLSSYYHSSWSTFHDPLAYLISHLTTAQHSHVIRRGVFPNPGCICMGGDSLCSSTERIFVLRQTSGCVGAAHNSASAGITTGIIGVIYLLVFLAMSD